MITIGTRISNCLTTWWFVAGVSGLLGLSVFLICFGFKPLDVTETAWLLNAGDLNQHYLGWVFFRDAPWSFPLGGIPDLAYPHGLSVTYMDSMPIFAIGFKLFSAWLPDSFQYFGIWGAMSYFLQGAIAGLVVRRLTRNGLISIVYSLLFVLSPLMLARMFTHTTLGGHWLVLMAILALLYSVHQTPRQYILCWIGILTVSIASHPYFALMSSVVFVISLIMRFTLWRQLAKEAPLPLISMLAVFWVIGGLSVKGSFAAGGLGAYGVNLNSPINPMMWSSVLPNLSTTPGGYEGFAYFGLGGLLLIAVALGVLITRIRRKQLHIEVGRTKLVLIVACVVLLGVAATAPIIHAGSRQLVIPRPEIVTDLWSVFRANGRLIWPLYYGTLCAAIWLVHRFTYTRRVLALACALLIVCVQFIDIVPSDAARALSSRTADKSTNYALLARLETDFSSKRHFQYVFAETDSPAFFDIAYFAHAHGMTMSDGYFARKPDMAIFETRSRMAQDLLDGTVDARTVYIADGAFMERYSALLEDVAVQPFNGVWLIWRR